MKTNTATKDLGIWMDHASAHLMEFTADPIQTKVVLSKFTHQAKEESMNKGEGAMHHKEQAEQADYYRELGLIIRGYDKVVLFGPTNAKVELHNTLKDNHLFSEVKFEILPSDKMTQHQEHAFVRDYFSKNN
jgi:hypothetical protein